MNLTLSQVIENFKKQNTLKLTNQYQDNLLSTIPSIIEGKRTSKLILCYPPILITDKQSEIIYPLYTPVSILCLEMKTWC